MHFCGKLCLGGRGLTFSLGGLKPPEPMPSYVAESRWLPHHRDSTMQQQKQASEVCVCMGKLGGWIEYCLRH